MSARKIFFRIVLVAAVLLLGVLCVYAGIWGMRFFWATAYRFVFLFLLIILYSNISAKLALVYFKA